MYAEFKQVWGALTGPGGDFEIDTIDIRGFPTRVYKNAPEPSRILALLSAIRRTRLHRLRRQTLDVCGRPRRSSIGCSLVMGYGCASR